MDRKWICLLMLVLVSLTACGSAGEPTDLIQTGRQHVEASRCEGVDQYAEAIEVLEEAVNVDPHAAEAFYWLYRAYEGAGDSEQATETLGELDALAAEGASAAASF